MTHQIIGIGDRDSGARACVLPGFGFNCYSFQVPHAKGALELLWSAGGFADGGLPPSGSGVPILFPFPGRIPGAVLHWDDRDFPLTASDGRGNAIHGFVIDRPWRVLDQAENRLVGQFQASIDEPSLLDCWPADFRITASYRVHGSALMGHFLIENPDDRPLPCGLGTHPYFRLPLGDGRPDDCQIRVPATAQWELQDLLATGHVTPLENADDFRGGIAFGDLQLDNVFTGLRFQEDRCRASIHDPDSGRTVSISFNRTFEQCVVYNPPHREAICIEPYSCVPGAFQLSQPAAPSGLLVLAPGESVEAVVDIVLE
ncbi:MAG: aldose epimerase [Planctomycetaceae bacterium]|nr:aldose epimerase [Planctomycetaceae bacterium]